MQLSAFRNAPRFGLEVTIESKQTIPSLQTNLDLLKTQPDYATLKDQADPINVSINVNEAGQVRAHMFTTRSGQVFLPAETYPKAESFWQKLTQNLQTLTQALRASYGDWNQPLFDTVKTDLTALLNQADLQALYRRSDDQDFSFELNTPGPRSFVTMRHNGSTLRLHTNGTDIQLLDLNTKPVIWVEKNQVKFQSDKASAETQQTQAAQFQELVALTKQVAVKALAFTAPV